MAQEQQQPHIVVWDPKGEYWEGALVEEMRANQLRVAGAAVLPVNPDLFRASGVGGYARRAWGAGWALDYGHPRMVTPLTLYCTREMRGIHWAARLVADAAVLDRVRAGQRLSGMLRFGADSSQRTPFFTGVAGLQKAVQAEELGAPDALDGWTVGGQGELSAPQDGHYGFGLHAHAPGLRVVWVAASLTTKPPT